MYCILVFATLKALQLAHHRSGQQLSQGLLVLHQFCTEGLPMRQKRNFSMTYARHTQRKERTKKSYVFKVLLQHELCAICACVQSRPRRGKLLVTFAFPTDPSAHEGRANKLVQECGCDTGN